MSIERKAVLGEAWMSGMIGSGKYSVDNFFLLIMAFVELIKLANEYVSSHKLMSTYLHTSCIQMDRHFVYVYVPS